MYGHTIVFSPDFKLVVTDVSNVEWKTLTSVGVPSAATERYLQSVDWWTEKLTTTKVLSELAPHCIHPRDYCIIQLL